MMTSASNRLPIETFSDDVFLVSYPKSGRTWVRFLIANYISGNQCDFLNSYLIVPGIDYNPEQCVNLQRPRFIQSHWTFTPEFKKVIFIVRDGRDVAVSYYFHLIKFKVLPKDTRFEDYLAMFNQGSLDNFSPWGDYIETWLNNAPEAFLLIKYEDLKADVVKELTKMIKFAGLPVNEDSVLEAVKASSFEKMKSHEQSGKLYEELGKTDLSIPHIRQGKVGSYKDYFDDKMLGEFVNCHGLALERLGYLSDEVLESSGIKQVKELNSLVETNNPEINVDELMQKVLEEVARRHKLSPSVEAKPINVSSGTNDTSVSYIETLLNDADSYAQVPTEFPGKFNRFPFSLSKGLQKFFLKVYGFIFKKQRVVNSSLSQALRESLVLNRRLIDQINSLQEQLNGMVNRVTVTEGRLTEMNYHLGATNEGLTEIGNRVTVTEGRLAEMNYHLSATNEGLLELSDHLTGTEARLSNTNEGLVEIDDRLMIAEGKLLEIGANLTVIDERHIRNDSYLKNDLAQQKRLITLFLEEAKQRFPEPFSPQQLQTFAKENEHSLDALYVAFEDKFRGSREDIFNRLKVYLPLIEEAKIGTPDSPFLDLGCGRGEWLELLRNYGYVAQGLDINRLMVEQCHTRGLEVIEADALSYMRTLPEASLGAVTGFHIIEHLPLEVLVKLLDETVRVLKTGGIAIFETPNPENILVSSHTFYLDPTHRHPLPSSLSKFLFESRNLEQVKIMNLHPYPDKFRLSGSDLTERFNEYFYGSQDYAVIAYKP